MSILLHGGGFIGDIRHGGSGQRLGQQPGTEHLRCLRQPQPLARHCGADASFAISPLHRIRHRQGQQAAYRIVSQGGNQPLHRRHRQATARRIMHQHPVLLAGLHGLQAIAHAFGATGSPHAQHAELGQVPFEIIKPFVTGRDHHHHPADSCHLRQYLQGVPHQRTIVQLQVLLGAGAAKAAAGTGGRHQGKIAAHAASPAGGFSSVRHRQLPLTALSRSPR